MVAETEAVPAMGDVRVTPATPEALVSTFAVVDKVPKVVVKRTHTPSQAAVLPPLFLKVTEREEVDPAGSDVGVAESTELPRLS
jgi:hypothetical protein